MTSIFPHLSLADPINDKVALLVQNYGDAFHSFSLVVLKYLLVPLESGLRITPPWLLLIFAGVLAWHATRMLSVAALFGLLLFAIGAFGPWDQLVQTSALATRATSR